MLQDDLTSVSLEKLLLADNWQAKYRLITVWGKLILPKHNMRLQQNLVKGCETSAWLTHYCVRGKHYFLFDSDSLVMNGLAALLLSQMNQQSAETLAELDVAEILQRVGLQKHLTPSRNNGFNRIVDRARELIGIIE